MHTLRLASRALHSSATTLRPSSCGLLSMGASRLLLGPGNSNSSGNSSASATGSGIPVNVTGQRKTGFSVKDSDVWQNRRHEWRTHRTYQGQVKAVVLDWAGTVLDSGVYSPAVVFIDVFAKYGVPISMEEARGPSGDTRGTAYALKRVMGAHKRVHIRKITQNPAVRERWKAKHGSYPKEEDVEAMFADFVPMQLAVLPKYTGMISGAVETVHELQKVRGLKIGSTTGFTTPMVDILKKAASQQGYTPDCYVAADEVPQARPYPFMVWLNAIRLNVSPIGAIVKVDDTADGVAEGITAGCWAVGLARSGNYMGMTEQELSRLQSSDPELYDRMLAKSYEILAAAGAHYVIDDINGLPRVIDDINRRLADGESP